MTREPGSAPGFAALALAGGGNRCYWQGGFLDALWRHTTARPRLIVAVSGGAFQACFTVAGVGDRVRARVREVCAGLTRNIDWTGPLAGRRLFPVGSLYPELLDETFGEAELDRLRAGPEVLIKISRPPPRLPVGLSVVAGLAGYQLEKLATNRLHPRVGRGLGFSPEFVSTHALRDKAELVAALTASSSVPPFMPVGTVAGRPALDGGLVDNVPVGPLEPIEAAGERTLVLLTRLYANLPAVPGRTYVQPSRRIAVNKFSITDGEGIAAAHRLGDEDGTAFARSL
ncbi:patatin-like phospholipase family protein [Alsobacter sp. R-9]